jgi:hypothetical protein
MLQVLSGALDRYHRNDKRREGENVYEIFGVPPPPVCAVCLTPQMLLFIFWVRVVSPVSCAGM